MSEVSNPQTMMVPAFGKSPALKLEMDNIREAERRIIEAKDVTPVTYADLEHTFNASYRDLKRHLSSIQYAITKAEQVLDEARADVMLDKYPAYLEANDKKDNSDLRKGFMTKDADVTAALDRIAQLKALESNFEGKLKVMENVCRYMRKQMDLLLRSGLAGRDLYNTIKK